MSPPWWCQTPTQAHLFLSGNRKKHILQSRGPLKTKSIPLRIPLPLMVEGGGSGGCENPPCSSQRSNTHKQERWDLNLSGQPRTTTLKPMPGCLLAHSISHPKDSRVRSKTSKETECDGKCYHLDRIWNHLGDKLLGGSVMDYYG